jgi:uncharacterized membrane protein
MMDEVIENLRGSLYTCGEFFEVILNAFSLLAIVIGMVMALIRSVQERQRIAGEHPLHTYFRRSFGGWLVVALEFQLAADIVGTIITPTIQQLIQLGAIAIIRTVLNYFLGRELRDEADILEREEDQRKRQIAETR